MTRLQKSKLNGQHKLTRVERRAFNKALHHCGGIKKDIETLIKQITFYGVETPFIQEVLKNFQSLCELCDLCVKNLNQKGNQNDEK